MLETVYKLKDNRAVRIASLDTTHAEMLMDFFFESVRQNGYFLMTTLEEAQQMVKSVDDEIQWIDNNNKDGNMHIAAFYEDKMVANAGVLIKRPAKQNHIAVFAIAILEDFISQGLGSAMMDIVIDWARSNPSLERLELHVFSDNLRAIRLYTAKGFQEEGRLVNAIKHGPDSYSDDIVMALQV